MSLIARLLKKERISSSESPDCGFPELPQLSTSDDCTRSELPPLLPISAMIGNSPKSESPAAVAEQGCPKPESPTNSTMKDNCSMCPFHKLCQDKLQCSVVLTRYGEQVSNQRFETQANLGDLSGQRPFELNEEAKQEHGKEDFRLMQESSEIEQQVDETDFDHWLNNFPNHQATNRKRDARAPDEAPEDREHHRRDFGPRVNKALSHVVKKDAKRKYAVDRLDEILAKPHPS